MNKVIVYRQLTKEEKKRFPSLLGYDEKGEPIYKKRIKEVTILNKRSSGEKVLFGIMFTVFLVHCLSLVLPFVWMFMSSLKDGTEYFMQESSFSLPQKVVFSNYIEAFSKLKINYNGKDTNLFGMLFNSIWFSAIKTFLYVMIPSCVGYVMSKFTFWGKEALYAYIVFMITFPVYGSGAAYMRLIHAIGLYDSPLFVVFTGLYGLGPTLLVHISFFKGISNSYAEAAKIDGANAFQIMFKIMLPQAAPMLLTYAITGMIGSWNIYEDVLLYLPSYSTIAAGLSIYETSSAAALNRPMYFAGILMSSVPSLILFATFSSKIMTSLSVGGLKG